MWRQTADVRLPLAQALLLSWPDSGNGLCGPLCPWSPWQFPTHPMVLPVCDTRRSALIPALLTILQGTMSWSCPHRPARPSPRALPSLRACPVNTGTAHRLAEGALTLLTEGLSWVLLDPVVTASLYRGPVGPVSQPRRWSQEDAGRAEWWAQAGCGLPGSSQAALPAPSLPCPPRGRCGKRAVLLTSPQMGAAGKPLHLLTADV